MNISSELEKLISLRDRGELSQKEFEKAKAVLLSGEHAGPIEVHKANSKTLAEKKKKCKTHLLTAGLLTLTAALSGVSVSINPSPLKVILIVLWVVAATLAWSTYFRFKTEIEKKEQSEP